MKLILGGNLIEIYQEIYLLVSRLHFSAEYIETITPVERRIYLMQYKDEKERDQDESNYNNEHPSLPHSKILGDMSNKQLDG